MRWWISMLIMLVSLLPAPARAIPSERASRIAIPTLQRLSLMDYAAAVKEMEGMKPELSSQYAVALGQIWDEKGDPKLARAYLDLALSIARQNKLKEREGEALTLCALHEDAHERLAEALDHIRAAAAILKTTGATEALKRCLSVKAGLEHRRGLYADCIKTHERLLALCEDGGDDLLKAHSIEEIALLQYKMGQAGDGEKKAREALAIFERNHHHKGIADCLKLLGNLAASNGRSEDAVGYSQRALESYAAARDVHGQANCQYNLGLSYRAMKQYDKSVLSFQEAIASYTRSSSVTGVGIANMELGNTYLSMGDLAKAEASLLLARSLLATSGNIARRAQTDESLGRLRLAQGKKEEAATHYEEAITHHESVNMLDDARRVRQVLNSIRSADRPTAP